jgi:hypothetical protein
MAAVKQWYIYLCMYIYIYASTYKCEGESPAYTYLNKLRYLQWRSMSVLYVR